MSAFRGYPVEAVEFLRDLEDNNDRSHQRPPLKEHVGLAVGYEGAGGYYAGCARTWARARATRRRADLSGRASGRAARRTTS